jgi:hypothetical protein
MSHARTWISVPLLCLAAYAPLAFSGHDADDEGESKAAQSLKNRAKAPKPADIDPAVGLDALLKKNGPDDWSQDKAGTVIGTVVQVEHEEDGDFHIVLAPAGGETDTTKWVIVEVPQAWRKKVPALAASKLDKLRGQRIKATGWLFYEPETSQPDPRGTRWELHPVTNIVGVDQPALEKKK